MRAVALRLVWIIGLACLIFGILGLLAFSPVTVALAVTGWFLTREASRHLREHGDIHAATPDLQYWARATLLRAFGLMLLGAGLSFGFVMSGFSLHLSWHAQALLTAGMIGVLVVVSRFMVPGFFAASWEVHGARKRRARERSSTVVSRFIVRTVAAMVVVTSLVGSFALMQSLRLGVPQANLISWHSTSTIP